MIYSGALAVMDGQNGMQSTAEGKQSMNEDLEVSAIQKRSVSDCNEVVEDTGDRQGPGQLLQLTRRF